MKKTIIMFLAAMSFLMVVRVAIMLCTPLFEPSEARYAAISANMARTGNFLVPNFTYKGTYRPFAGKPPLVFQASGMFCRILGLNELSVRLTPFLSFLGLLAILFLVVRRLADAATGMLATGICASSVALYATAGFCMMDVPLTFCSSGALLLYALHRNGSPQPRPLVICGVATLLGLGMLVKGPVALAIFGLPVLADAAINRKWQHILSLRWLPGILLFLAISAPWFWRMETAQPGFLRYFFVNENIMRFSSAVHAPPRVADIIPPARHRRHHRFLVPDESGADSLSATRRSAVLRTSCAIWNDGRTVPFRRLASLALRSCRRSGCTCRDSDGRHRHCA